MMRKRSDLKKSSGYEQAALSPPTVAPVPLVSAALHKAKRYIAFFPIKKRKNTIEPIILQRIFAHTITNECMR